MDFYSLPENLHADQKRAIEELIQGRELAKQLQIMLSQPLKDDDDGHEVPPLSSAGHLVTKILGSFKNSLLILNSSGSDEASQFPAKTGGSCDGGHKSDDDSGESSKTSTLKDRRGCYKRRRTSEALTRVTPTLTEDGYAWRKYGQKAILNAKYPRNYFRCTHKFDQGCQATKQVQRTEENPPMHRTTYHGHHTCRRNNHLLLNAPQFILDSTTRDSSNNSILLNFQPSNQLNAPPSDFPFIKLENYKQEDLTSTASLKNHNIHNQNSSSSRDYYLSRNNLTTFGSSELLSPASSDHGDAISSGLYSCTTGTTHSNFDMDMIVEGVNFDDDDDDSFGMDTFLL